MRAAVRRITPAHQGHGVHIDAGLGGAHVDAGADDIGPGQRLGDGLDQTPVSHGHALLDQGGEAADKVHAALPGGPVHGDGEGNVVLGLAGPGDQGHGRDGDALVDDGNAQFLFNALARGHQVLGAAADLVIDLPGGGLGIGVGAVQERDTHGDGADVQVLLGDHIDGLHNIGVIEKHGGTSCLPRQMRCMAWKISSRWMRMDRCISSSF